MDIVIVLMALMMVAAVVAIIFIYASRYVKVPPNKAMVVFGRGGFMVITGGAKFILPVVESYEFMDLELMKRTFVVTRVVTADSRNIDVDVWCSFCIDRSQKGLMLASENLLHKSGEEISDIVEKFVSGHVRGTLSRHTLDTIDRGLGELAGVAMADAAKDLSAIGLGLAGLELRGIGERKFEDGLAALKDAQNKIDSLEKRLAFVEKALVRK